jgi:hypothetical protein
MIAPELEEKLTNTKKGQKDHQEQANVRVARE